MVAVDDRAGVRHGTDQPTGGSPKRPHVLEDPVVAGDAMAAQWAQFVGAAAHHLAQRWPDVLKITAKSPPAHATHVVDDLTAAVDTLAAAAAASIGQFQTALDRASTVTTKNQYIAADAALTRAGACANSARRRPPGHRSSRRPTTACCSTPLRRRWPTPATG